MTDIQYVLLDPTGNQTILVETAVPAAVQPFVAKQIMTLEPDAEQTGFVSVSGDSPALRMAGGEFCGNATMSTAALFAWKQGIRAGSIPVRVAGTPDPVPVTISSLPDGSIRGTVRMPDPVSVKEETLPEGLRLPVVRFHGISHVILETPVSRSDTEAVAPAWCAYLHSDSLGILLFDPDTDTLSPLVYVPGTETLFWEHSCASGSAAVAAYLYSQKGPCSLSLCQPGGTLLAETNAEGSISLTGTVRMRYRRTIHVDL